MEKKKLNRLESLDVLRGFNLFCLVVLEMVLHPLAHAIAMGYLIASLLFLHVRIRVQIGIAAVLLLIL